MSSVDDAEPASVLIVDDDQSMAAMLEQGLGAAGFSAWSTTSAHAALERLHQADFDVVITDVRMGAMSGLELCQRIVDVRPDIPVIVITAFGSMDTAVEAIRAGAFDFVTKPFSLDSIRMAAHRAARHRALSRRVERLAQALGDASKSDRMIGASQVMKDVFDLVARAARTDASVLITGESGTGKELVARALHTESRRKDGPFVAINCAAMPEHLLESELFGHKRGAFTDARENRQGLFQEARGGTLLLDEIGEMPLGLQPKLLRALQERAVRPVGGTREEPIDVRIVAATNRDLEAQVAAHRFREDLYYRIQVIQIDVPPLRARGQDVLLLAQHFVASFAALANRPVRTILPNAAACLLAYHWPGNVRELQNVVERAVALCAYSEISADDLPPKIRESAGPRPVVAARAAEAEILSMDEVERRHVLRVFESFGRNKSLTAKALGFNRKTLYRKLRRYGAIPPEAGGEDED